MIQREYYTLWNNRRFYIDDSVDFIHLAATGKIAIHALVSNMAIEPHSINDDGSLKLMARRHYTGLVQLEAEDIMRFEADGYGEDVRTVQLPPFDGTLYAFPLNWTNYGRPGFCKDLSIAIRDELVIRDTHLVITTEEIKKAGAFFKPEGEDSPSDGHLLDKDDKPVGTKERRTLLTLVAALCKELRIDPKQRGASQRIMALTEQIGAKVDDGTIKNYLDQIPDALESRMK
jgi:hypothetical protein